MGILHYRYAHNLILNYLFKLITTVFWRKKYSSKTPPLSKRPKFCQDKGNIVVRDSKIPRKERGNSVGGFIHFPLLAAQSMASYVTVTSYFPPDVTAMPSNTPFSFASPSDFGNTEFRPGKREASEDRILWAGHYGTICLDMLRLVSITSCFWLTIQTITRKSKGPKKNWSTFSKLLYPYNHWIRFVIPSISPKNSFYERHFQHSHLFFIMKKFRYYGFFWVNIWMEFKLHEQKMVVMSFRSLVLKRTGGSPLFPFSMDFISHFKCIYVSYLKLIYLYEHITSR